MEVAKNGLVVSSSVDAFHAACILWDREIITSEALKEVACVVFHDEALPIFRTINFLDDCGLYPFEEF